MCEAFHSNWVNFMNKQILVGVGTGFSVETQHMLHTVGELLAQSSPQSSVLLLHVVSQAQIIAPHHGMYSGQVVSLEVTPVQRREAEIALRKAQLLLQQHGITAEHITSIVRVGAPADEIAKVAGEIQASLIIVGSRGESLKQSVRRFFIGSHSRRVLRLAPCPVLIVKPPQPESPIPPRQPTDLVTWYGNAVTRYLSEHPDTLQVFTPQQVAHQFVPPRHRVTGRKEIAAAALALEELARSGILCRHDVEGELRYVND